MRIIKSERRDTKDSTTFQVTLEFSGTEANSLRPGNYTGPDIAAEERERMEKAAGALAIQAVSVLIQ